MTKRSRSLLQRAQAIFSLIKSRSQPYIDGYLTKSDFQEVGISPKDTGQWFELIQFIQNMPRVEVGKKGKTTIVRSVDNNFMLHLRNRMYNTGLSYEEREAAAAMYIKILINIEKGRGDEIDWKSLINDPWKISRPTIVQLVEKGAEMENSERQ